MQIVAYDKQYAKAFELLNLEWLETYFYVEDYDREVLSKVEQYIIGPGGHIFFAVESGVVMGCVALLRIEDDLFELTKMAVSPAARGKGIGQKLMQHCIAFAKSQNWKGLLLYSNRILENAIHIYRKYGFKEIPVEPDSPYERSNIKMYLTLK
ncbi:GNAT family N-acetyltransferase [Gilvibacter sp.]|jgi:N-acetylglutamate synthase-like GNAT family acetyltransferase|uniref:GNAT family N-acetyltransferase n=1 Tax=Gilvibacter sp. TaxID=2729997 RepID=UPI0035BE9A8D